MAREQQRPEIFQSMTQTETMNDFFTWAGIAGAVVATLAIGGIITLFLFHKLRPFLDLLKTVNIISNLKREVTVAQEDLALAKKQIKTLTDQNNLLREEIAQRDKEIILLGEHLAKRDTDIKKLVDKINAYDKLLNTNNKEMRGFQIKLAKHDEIMQTREQRIFDFMEKYLGADSEDIKYFLRLGEEKPKKEKE